MMELSNNKMKELFSRAVEMELDQFEAEEKLQRDHMAELGMEEIQDLAERISLLLPSDQSLLYFHYCFGIRDKSAGEILGITRPFAKRNYVEKLLSVFMLDTSDSREERRIGEESMKRACEKALLDYASYDPTEFSGYPVYSKRFRKKLKKIRAAQKTEKILPVLIKRAAAVLLVITMGFTTVMVADAGFREKVAEWFIQAFTEFSRFQIGNMSGESDDGLKYTIEYVPDGFELTSSSEEESICFYVYEHGNDKITITYADFPISSALDVENAVIEPFEFHGNTAYRWKIQNMNYLIWSQSDVQFSIASTLELSEIYNIANGIKIN